MIEAIWNVIFTFILRLIDLFPITDMIFEDNSIFDDLSVCIGYLNSFIGLDIFLVVVAHTLVFFTAEFTWTIVEWIYKKIPGVK